MKSLKIKKIKNRNGRMGIEMMFKLTRAIHRTRDVHQRYTRLVHHRLIVFKLRIKRSSRNRLKSEFL